MNYLIAIYLFGIVLCVYHYAGEIKNHVYYESLTTRQMTHAILLYILLTVLWPVWFIPKAIYGYVFNI
jgi:hypothetical protein